MAGTSRSTRRSRKKQLKNGDRLPKPKKCKGDGLPWEDSCPRTTHYYYEGGLCVSCHVQQQPYTKRAMRGHWKPARGTQIKWQVATTSTRSREPKEVRGVVVFCGAAFDNPRDALHASHWWAGEEEMEQFQKALEKFPNTIKHLESKDGVIVKVERTGKKGRRLQPHYYMPNLYFCDPVEDEEGDTDE